MFPRCWPTSDLGSSYILNHPDDDGKSPMFGVDHLVWDLVPASNRIRLSGYFFIIDDNVLPMLPTTDGNRYWDDLGYVYARYLQEDVFLMANTIERFQADIERGIPGADQSYEDFKRRTKEHAAQLTLVS